MNRCPECNDNITGTLIDAYVNDHFDRCGIAFVVCPFCGNLLRVQITPDVTLITISRKYNERSHYLYV